MHSHENYNFMQKHPFFNVWEKIIFHIEVKQLICTNKRKGEEK